mmetsp:Transcript_82310/g.142646  ORF Transcript_82310/g.142646 Transcript_82310/m.142646 type:complete len:400 (-) Transcript_82310:27-1226(-)
MGAFLCAPVRSQLVSRAGNQHVRVGGAMMQGFREEMEDAHCICLGLEGHPDVAFYGVYDGHSGDKVSKHLAKELHHRIAKLGPDFEDEALQKAVIKLDLEVGRSEIRNNGSTCVFVLVRPLTGAASCNGQSSEKGEIAWRISAFNVGDSRAMLVRANGTLVDLTKDHKPSNRQEAARIRKAGGFVQNDRTDGELAMSRAIGDFKYKLNPELSELDQKVIALPDVMHEVARPGDRLLVICDGVVEQLTNKEVASFVHSNMKHNKSDPAMLMRELLFHSLRSGSTDNHSAILVCFGYDGTEYAAPDVFMPGPLGPARQDPKFVAAYIKNAEAWGQKREALPKLIAEAEASMPRDWKQESQPSSDWSTSAIRILLSVVFLILAYYAVFEVGWGSRDGEDVEM